MIRRLFLALCILTAQPGSAEVSLGKFKTIETRFGVLGVVWRPEGTEFVVWNGKPLPGLETAEITIGGGYATEGEAFDWVVLQTRHGGNMCPHEFVLLKVSASGVQRTDQIGTCLGNLVDLRVLPGQLEVELFDSDIRYDRQLFLFTGDSLTQQPVAASASAAMAQGGADVTRWAGKSLFEVLRDPSEIARFTSIMPADTLEELRRATALPVPAQLQGGWLIGTGCQRHLCNLTAGLWAIRVADGAPFGAFVYGDGTPMAVRGDQTLLADPVLGRALSNLQIRMNRR